jgi:glyoxalase family protein
MYRMSIIGLHHITLVSADAQRTVDFYTRVLGLRLVKKTVNFDDPGSYHLYFGDERGQAGSVITFFEWGSLPQGAPGIGGTHHFALQVADEGGLWLWKRRLSGLGLRVTGPYNRQYFRSIYFRDPDGTIVEIATRGPGFAVDEAPDSLGQHQVLPPPALDRAPAAELDRLDGPVPDITPEMSLRGGMHHISAIASDIARTDAFYRGFLGLERLKMTVNYDDPSMAHWYWGVEGGRPGSVITYFEYPKNGKRARIGPGQTHHFALAVKDEQSQLEWREKMLSAGLPVSPVMDRIYFKSIYSRDPDGHIIELATAGPGFLVDEDEQSLGSGLKLPPWLERNRAEIETLLRPVHLQQPAGPDLD